MSNVVTLTAKDAEFYVRLSNNNQQFKGPVENIKSIAWEENTASIPVYGVGNNFFRFVTRGNSIVQGKIELYYNNMNAFFEALNLTGFDSYSVIKKKIYFDIRILNVFKELKDFPFENFEEEEINEGTPPSFVISNCIVTGQNYLNDRNYNGPTLLVLTFLAREITTLSTTNT